MVCLICSCCSFVLDRTAREVRKALTKVDKAFGMSCSISLETRELKMSSSNLLSNNVCISVFQVIRDFFPSILVLAQTFLHAAHPAIVSFGSCMYKQAFAVFDSYCQQVQCDGFALFVLVHTLLWNACPDPSEEGI